MANDDPNKSTQFKPGNKMGKGRPKLPEEVRRIRKMAHDEFLEVAQLMLKPEKEIDEYFSSGGQSVSFLVRHTVNSIRNGNSNALEAYLNRLLGKPRHNIDVDREFQKPEEGQLLSKEQRDKMSILYLAHRGYLDNKYIIKLPEIVSNREKIHLTHHVESEEE